MLHTRAATHEDRALSLMRDEGGDRAGIIEFPAGENDPVEIALEELEMVYAFIFSRVGNRPDAEDLTQVVALKAIPRLRAGAGTAAIRAYLFATARSALGGFWAAKFGISQEELREELVSAAAAPTHSEDAADRATRILARLPDNYRRVLELRFLRGYSIKEVAAELKATPGSVKVMQLRALRAAAKVRIDA